MSPILTLLTAITLFGLVPPAPAGTYPTGLIAMYPNETVAKTIAEPFSLARAMVAVMFYLSCTGPRSGEARTSPLGNGSQPARPSSSRSRGRPAHRLFRDLQSLQRPRCDPTNPGHTRTRLADYPGYLHRVGHSRCHLPNHRLHPTRDRDAAPSCFRQETWPIVTGLALAALVGVNVPGVGSALYAPIGLFALIVVPPMLGWRLKTLSRAA